MLFLLNIRQLAYTNQKKLIGYVFLLQLNKADLENTELSSQRRARICINLLPITSNKSTVFDSLGHGLGIFTDKPQSSMY